MAKQSLEEFNKKLKRWMRAMPKEVEISVKRGADFVIAYIQKEHLSGPKMPRGVGHASKATLAVGKGDRLRKAINKRVSVTARRITALIGVKLKYGPIHEFGGIIRPKRFKFLHWKDETGEHFAKKVKIPARPYLRPSIREKRKDVMVEILEGAMRSYRKS